MTRKGFEALAERLGKERYMLWQKNPSNSEIAAFDLAMAAVIETLRDQFPRFDAAKFRQAVWLWRERGGKFAGE